MSRMDDSYQRQVEEVMIKRKHTLKKIILNLRQREVLLGQGKHICLDMRISEATYYKWRKSYAGTSMSEDKRPRNLEAENVRLCRAIADLILDKQILQEYHEGNL